MEKKDKNVLQSDRYMSLAAIYARLGEKEKALEQLTKEVEADDYDLWLKTDPAYDRLREDPQFKALLKKAGLDQ